MRQTSGTGQRNVSPEKRFSVLTKSRHKIMKNQAGRLAAIVLLTGLGGATLQSQSIEIASKPLTPEPAGLGDSGAVDLSADGRWAAFMSSANNLAPNDSNGFVNDIFVRDLQAKTNLLVTAGGDNNSSDPVFSPDGKFVLFTSEASNLVANDTNNAADVFLYDLTAGKAEILSLNTAGELGNGESGAASFSPDGKLVLFESLASNLTANDTNAGTDLFIRDLAAKTTTALTLKAGNTATADSSTPVVGVMNSQFTSDGKYVVFESPSTNLVVQSGTPYHPQVFARDLAGNSNIIISASATGARAAAPATQAVVSGNGRMVAFLAATGNLTGESLSGGNYLFVKDLETLTIVRIPLPTGQTLPAFESVVLDHTGQKIAFTQLSQAYIYDLGSQSYTLVSGTEAGDPADGTSFPELFTPDGTQLLYTSTATDLPGVMEGNGSLQAYLFNLATRAQRLLSTNHNATAGAASDVLYPTISGDGSRIAFSSFDTDLVAEDSNKSQDIFALKTDGTGSVELVSAADPQVIVASANQNSTGVDYSLSLDGAKLLYRSTASNLTANDQNAEFDLFVYDLAGKTNQLVSADSSAVAGSGSVLEGYLSADGKYVTFTSTAPDLVPDDTNNVVDIFRKDLRTGAIEVVTRRANGDMAEASSSAPQISADGNVIAFQSTAKLTAENLAGTFVRFMREGVTRYLGNTIELRGGALLPGGAHYVNSRGLVHEIAPSGPITTYSVTTNGTPSFGPNYASAAYNGLLYLSRVGTSTFELRMYDLGTRDSFLVASTNTGAAVMSANQQFVAYTVYNLSPREGSLLLFDRAAGTNKVVFTAFAATPSFVGAFALDREGRFLVFTTMTSLTAQDQNNATDVYLYDRVFDSTILVSRNPAGSAGNQISVLPSISADGSVIAFTSSSTDLVAGDLNNALDVFAYRLALADTDNDGLEDGWEIAWFGNLDQTATGDQDGDGISNSGELIAGTSPVAAMSVLRVYRITNIRDGRVALLWQSIAGKRYQVQYKDDLAAAWQNLGEPYTAVSLATEQIDQPLSNRFYRVVVLP